MKDLNNKIYLFPFLLILVVLLFMFFNTNAKDTHSLSIQDLRIQNGIDYNSLPVYNTPESQQHAQSHENVVMPVVPMNNSTDNRTDVLARKSYREYSCTSSSQPVFNDPEVNRVTTHNSGGANSSSAETFQSKRSGNMYSGNEDEGGYSVGNLLSKKNDRDNIGSQVLLADNLALTVTDPNQGMSNHQRRTPGDPPEPPGGPVGNGLWVLLLFSCGYLYVIKKRNIKSVEE